MNSTLHKAVSSFYNLVYEGQAFASSMGRIDSADQERYYGRVEGLNWVLDRCQEIEDVDMNLQLTGYSFAYYVKKGKIPGLRLDVLLKYKNPRLDRMPTSRTLTDFRKFFYLAKQIIKGIKSEVFLPLKSWRCTDCEFRQQCWLFNGVPK